MNSAGKKFEALRKKVMQKMQYVSLEKGKVLVRLNSLFYPKSAIEAAEKQFCESCDLEIRKQGKFFCISLAPKSEALCKKETGLLFCNFALAAMQTK